MVTLLNFIFLVCYCDTNAWSSFYVDLYASDLSTFTYYFKKLSVCSFRFPANIIMPSTNNESFLFSFPILNYFFLFIYQGSEDFHTFNRSGNVEELCLISRLREIAFNILPSDITFAVYYILWTSYDRSTYFPSIYGFNIMDNRTLSDGFSAFIKIITGTFCVLMTLYHPFSI